MEKFPHFFIPHLTAAALTNNQQQPALSLQLTDDFYRPCTQFLFSSEEKLTRLIRFCAIKLGLIVCARSIDCASSSLSVAREISLPAIKDCKE
jgi:hypothetical protein